MLWQAGGERKVHHMLATELKFADDATVVGDCKERIVRAAEQLVDLLLERGSTMSFPKTKLLVTGATCGEDDLQPMYTRGETIEAVSSFRYLGSILESHGEIRIDVEDRVAHAFGALCRPVLCNVTQSWKTMRMVYCAAVLGVPLYVAETLAIKRVSTKNGRGIQQHISGTS